METVVPRKAQASARWHALALAALVTALGLLPKPASAAHTGALASGRPPERMAVPGSFPLREPAASAGELDLRYASSEPVEVLVSLACGRGETGREPVYLPAGPDEEAAFLVGAFDAVPPLPPTCSEAAVTDLSWLPVPGVPAPSILLRAVAWRPASPPPRLVWLDDRTLRVGIDLAWGGSVSELRDPADHVAMVYLPDGKIELGPGYARWPGALVLARDPNLLDDHDTGRSIQQSYYGSPPGYVPSTYNGHRWTWNPVQGGDRYGDHSLLLSYRATETTAYVEAEPLDWAMRDQPAAAVLQEWYALDGRSLTLTMRLTTFTAFLPRAHDQELPAAYFDPALHRFAYAAAGAHGSGRIVSLADPGPWFPDYAGHTYTLAEGWSAWTDPTGWGVGLCTPGVSQVLAGSTLASPYDLSQGAGGRANPTDYAAPIRALVLPSFGTLTYRTRVVVGALGAIRAACEGFAAPRGSPALEVRSYTVAPPP